MEADEIQLWRVHAEASGRLYDRCRDLLTADEVERLKRLRPGMAADEFVVGRGSLRMLLGAALRQSPREIVLQTGAHGKPFTPGIEFSVSHSRGLILIALSWSATLGVDVEAIDPTIEALEIARDTFAASEIAVIEKAQEGAERVQVFYRWWARKEAVAKAHGQGITLSLKEFAVDVDAEEEREIFLSAESNPTNRCFFVRGISLPIGFAGALAAGESNLPLRCFDLERTALLNS
ncbi:4'-phosphopantetheinyl transferase family protein [Granulicella tundricola]|uniref:4'-phosphopantetheinyl transferase family protein n=1 Tax=Granulicella tundricola TaxID=940615 RepID=UPI0012F90A53|nr:4'-phosphopantetheinyl transferase superfamily protein [Granulicella tundricola]